MVTRELLKKFQQGCCTPDELALLLPYLLNDKWPELKKILDEDWHETDHGDLGEGSKERVWLHLQESIRHEETGTHSRPQVIVSVAAGKRLTWWRPVAASLAFILLAGMGYFLWGGRGHFNKGGELVEQVNTSDRPVKINLADGSEVTLYPQSKLRYPKSFTSDSRNIQLDGEAFFSVVKDPKRPFYVKTARLSVKVLGTSFTVNAYRKSSASEVSVRSGKVTVSRPGENSDIILLPNERISFSEKEAKPAKKLLKIPVIVDNKISETEFEFSGTPVPAVFEMLKKAYKVDIVYDESVVKNCTLTARLCDQPLFTKLEMVCATIGAGYYVKDTSIHITVTEGCSEKEK